MSYAPCLPLRWAVSLLGLVLAADGGGFAQELRAPLTVQDAVERALESYPSIRVAEAGHTEARASLREVETTRRPRLDVRSSAVQYQKETIVSPIHGFSPGLAPPFDQTLFQTGLEGTYTLYDGGVNGARTAQARFQSEAADTAIEGARDVVITRVVVAYARILSQREILSAHDRRLTALEAELARVNQLLEVGRAARLEVLRVSAALAGATADRVRLAEALEIAERDLARLTGAPPTDTRADRLVPFELAPVAARDRDHLAYTAAQANPAIQEARRRLAAADAAIAVAESAGRPQLRLTGSLIDFGSAAGHFTNEWSAGVQIAYPLFDGGAVRERTARATAARDGAAERLRLFETEIQGELDRVLSAVREAGARRTSLIPAVEQFEEVARIERLRLDVGAGTLTDFLDVEADLLAARASLVDAEYAELTARVELARVTGELDQAWLRQNVRTSP